MGVGVAAAVSLLLSTSGAEGDSKSMSRGFASPFPLSLLLNMRGPDQQQ